MATNRGRCYILNLWQIHPYRFLILPLSLQLLEFHEMIQSSKSKMEVLRNELEIHSNMFEMLIFRNNVLNTQFPHEHYGGQIGERYPGLILVF